MHALLEFGNRISFIIDILPFSIPVLIFSHANLLEDAKKYAILVQQICISTGQETLFYTSILPFFSPSILSTPPSPTISSSISQSIPYSSTTPSHHLPDSLSSSPTLPLFTDYSSTPPSPSLSLTTLVSHLSQDSIPYQTQFDFELELGLINGV